MMTYTVTVIGMGKIGLPLAVQCASRGIKVYGADINQKTVDCINSGKEPFPGEAFLQEKLASVIESGLLEATTDTVKAVSKSNVVLVVVPLYVDDFGTPDFGWMDEASASIAAGLKSGTLICYETTLPIGTTRQRFTPNLERLSKLKAGKDFFVSFSPERVFSGKIFSDLMTNPKIVGGIDELSGNMAADFYNSILEFEYRPDLKRENGVWNVGSSEASEFVKLAETTYRDVNIGLANQFARYAHAIDVDISKVIEACNSQPYSHIHSPGIAVGGHCIPVYPQMYLWNDPEASIVSAARKVNKEMPSYSVEMIQKLVGNVDKKKIVILGISYRGNVKESAFSGIFPLVNELSSLGAEVSVSDPYFSSDEIAALGFEEYRSGDPVSVVIVQADHSGYASLKESDFPGAELVFDGREILDRNSFAHVQFARINT